MIYKKNNVLASPNSRFEFWSKLNFRIVSTCPILFLIFIILPKAHQHRSFFRRRFNENLPELRGIPDNWQKSVFFSLFCFQTSRHDFKESNVELSAKWKETIDRLVGCLKRDTPLLWVVNATTKQPRPDQHIVRVTEEVCFVARCSSFACDRVCSPGPGNGVIINLFVE